MENNQNILRINPAITIAVILQLIFIVFAGVTIHNLLNSNTGAPEIKISNYSAMPEGEIIGNNNTPSNTQGIDFTLDDTAKHIIGSTIYSAVLINDKSSISNHGAKIREGSARHAYIEDLSAYFLNFIVDIKELGQSYHFAWLGDSSFSGQNLPEVTFLMAFCPREDELVYGNFDCKDEYDGLGLDMVVYNLLHRRMFQNSTIWLSDVYGGEPLTMTINTRSDDEAAKAAAVQEVSGYLSSLGFSLDDFEYTVQYATAAS